MRRRSTRSAAGATPPNVTEDRPRPGHQRAIKNQLGDSKAEEARPRRRRIPGETLPSPDIDSFAAIAGGWKLIHKRACDLLAGTEVQRISEVLQRAVVVEGVGPLALEPQPA